MPRKPLLELPNSKQLQDLRYAAQRGLLNNVGVTTQHHQTRTSSLNNPDAFLPHLSRTDRLLRSDALEHANGVVSPLLKPPSVRNSRIGRRALDTIIREKGCYLARLEDMVQEWVLYVHPRDLDGGVFQDEYSVGRRLLDYGDLPACQPRAPPAYNPFTSTAEVSIKEEEDDLDGNSTKVQSSEESTMCGDIVEHNKENAMAWNHSTGWEAGLKRKAAEFDADRYGQGEEPGNEPKRPKMM